MLEQLKLLLGISEDDVSQDDLLNLILSQSTADAEAFTHRTLTESMYPVVIEMSIIRYNNLGSEGDSMQRLTGSVVQIAQGYPDWIMSQLRSFRKIRTVE